MFFDHSLYSWSLRDVLGPFLMILDPSYVLYSSLKILVHPLTFLGLPCVLGPLLISGTIPYVLGPSFTFLGPLCSWLFAYALSLHSKKCLNGSSFMFWDPFYIFGLCLCFDSSPILLVHPVRFWTYPYVRGYPSIFLRPFYVLRPSLMFSPPIPPFPTYLFATLLCSSTFPHVLGAPLYSWTGCNKRSL